MDSVTNTRLVTMGTMRNIEYPSQFLGHLNSTDKTESSKLLQSRLNKYGYLYIKDVIPACKIIAARQTILDHMETWQTKEQKVFVDKSSAQLDSRCGRGCVKSMEGRKPIDNSKSVREVLENQNLIEIFEKLFDGKVKTFDFKWLRAMYIDGYTGAHVDAVYMQRGAMKTLTCWIPLGDIPVELGGLALCEASHIKPSFDKLHDTYSLVDLEAENITGTGWFSNDPQEITRLFGGEWKTTDYKMGDVVIFTLKTVHMTLTNTTNIARISCDTRWYPANEKADPRYVGDEPSSTEVSNVKYGVWSEDDDLATTNQTITIEKLKQTIWKFV